MARDELAGSVPPSLIDAAIAGPLPEILVRSSFEHRLPERIAGELDDAAVQRLVQQMFNSAEFEHALESALSSPRVRAAFTSQGTRFADEIVGSLRRRAASLDDRLSRKRDTTAPFAYAGLASRAAAFAIDLLLAQIVFLVGTALVALVVSLVGSLRPEWLAQAIAGVAWIASVARVLRRLLDARRTDARDAPRRPARHRPWRETAQRSTRAAALRRADRRDRSALPRPHRRSPSTGGARGLQDMVAGTAVRLQRRDHPGGVKRRHLPPRRIPHVTARASA